MVIVKMIFYDLKSASVNICFSGRITDCHLNQDVGKFGFRQIVFKFNLSFLITFSTSICMQACASGQDDGQKQDDIILLLGQSSWAGRMMLVFVLTSWPSSCQSSWHQSWAVSSSCPTRMIILILRDRPDDVFPNTWRTHGDPV